MFTTCVTVGLVERIIDNFYFVCTFIFTPMFSRKYLGGDRLLFYKEVFTSHKLLCYISNRPSFGMNIISYNMMPAARKTFKNDS